MSLKPKSLLFNGKYRVIRLLGAGRFGTVYLAREEKYAVDRAVKLLSTADEGVGTTVYDDLRMRYRLEYQLGTKLDHPNVVRALTVEEDGETIGLVMEYAAGGSLARRLKTEGRLDIEESLRLLRDCARGLRALHALDAVHRDVKPSNILLTGDGRAKIGDLGLAQVPGGPSARTMLGDNALPHPGTPEYMSPEHRHPDSLSPTSDVYGLGCVAWEMLTGTVWRNAMHKVGSLRDLRPESPDWLDALLRRMLADVPGLRPQDAADENKRFVDMQGLLEALEAGPGRAGGKALRADDGPSLSQAVVLMDAGAFAEAIAMLEALRAGGMASHMVDALLVDAREAQAEEVRRLGVHREYEAIATMARGKSTEHRALEAWERFHLDHPDWDEDPDDLVAWAAGHPLTVARRKAEAEAEARRNTEAESEARCKADAGAVAPRKEEAARLVTEQAQQEEALARAAPAEDKDYKVGSETTADEVAQRAAPAQEARQETNALDQQKTEVQQEVEAPSAREVPSQHAAEEVNQQGQGRDNGEERERLRRIKLAAGVLVVLVAMAMVLLMTWYPWPDDSQRHETAQSAEPSTTCTPPPCPCGDLVGECPNVRCEGCSTPKTSSGGTPMPLRSPTATPYKVVTVAAATFPHNIAGELKGDGNWVWEYTFEAKQGNILDIRLEEIRGDIEGRCLTRDELTVYAWTNSKVGSGGIEGPAAQSDACGRSLSYQVPADGEVTVKVHNNSVFDVSFRLYVSGSTSP